MARHDGFSWAGFFVARAVQSSEGEYRASGRLYDIEGQRQQALDMTQLQIDDRLLSFDSSLAGESGRVFASRAPIDQSPTEAARMAGDYSFQLRSPLRSRNGGGRASVSSDGALRAELDGGCVLTGKMTARPRGNLYAASTTPGDGCNLGAEAFDGHAMQSYLSGHVYLFLTSRGGDGMMVTMAPQDGG